MHQTEVVINAQFKMARRVKEEQRSFAFVGWGGRRDDAGRPKKDAAKLRHGARAPLAARYPVDVTLRALPDAPNLRRSASYEVIERALRATRERDGFRVVHFSVQTNHLHLLVEANGADALSRGMQGLAISVARGVNRVSRRAGKLWADRFHSRILRSPREVRLAVCYVLQNTPEQAPTAKPQTWLLSEGWRRHGLIRVDEVPRAAFGSR
jgi:REP-associated tyrosine transposase